MSSSAVPQLPNDLLCSMDLAGQVVTVLPDASRFPSPLPLPPEEVSFLPPRPAFPFPYFFLLHCSSRGGAEGFKLLFPWIPVISRRSNGCQVSGVPIPLFELRFLTVLENLLLCLSLFLLVFSFCERRGKQRKFSCHPSAPRLSALLLFQVVSG